jgi:hypothetical protein
MYLDWMAGRTVTRVDVGKDDEFVVIHFEDGTMWMVTSVRCNAAGSKLLDRTSFGHRSTWDRCPYCKERALSPPELPVQPSEPAEPVE